MRRIGVGPTLLLFGLALSACARGVAETAAPSPQGRPGGRQEQEEGMKPYAEVVPAAAVSDSGLFLVHTVDDKLLYEIPLERLDQEMLLLTRIARTASGIGYGGSKANTATVRWQKEGKTILLRLVSHQTTADEELPVYESVRNSSFEPVIEAFPVQAYSPDSSAVVVDVTSLFETDIPLLGLQKRYRTEFNVRRLDTDRSFLLWSKSFPTNVEVRAVLTYEATEPPSNSSSNTISVEMNHSMVLLPEDPMQPRIWDQRVGVISIQQVDYGVDAQRAVTRRYITRWRLEPKDTAAFLRGELVEPVKPIVYYIDSATPEKWRPYLMQGVEDWQEAFEAAGFENAIVARMAPTPEEDPDFSPEDARYSVIRYLASTVQNASGPHVHDPRTGEILESDVQWYHNVMNLLRNWYFVQTSAANPEARGVSFDDQVMGELIRFVSAHEVGHTLGLPHNMKASSAFPVDSLRTRFVCRYGTATTIMDYARFNYVAQPGDETCFMPRIGPYDLYSINWAYRPILGAESPVAELPTLREWILAKADDPIYHFGDGSQVDPTSLSEALGDDAMRASDLSIENLKLTMAHLMEWSYEEGEDYSQLQELYTNILGQWNRYTGHVVANIGGVYWTRRSQGEAGEPFMPVPKEVQQRAMDYLARQVFATPTWMLNTEILRRIEDSGAPDRIGQLQLSGLTRVLNVPRMKRLIEQEAFRGEQAYSLNEMLDDLRAAVWREAGGSRSIDVYRRNLQRGYLERMGELLVDEEAAATDIVPFVRGQLETLKTEIRARIARASDRATRLHLEDALVRIDEILDTEDRG